MKKPVISVLVSMFVATNCLVAGLAAQPASAVEGAGTWTPSTFRNTYGQRNYYVYLPAGYRGPARIPLLVMLHGCTQSAADFAHATQMNGLADDKGFAILYPEQDSGSNSSKCWNWFKPENFTRGGGELGIIMGMIAEVEKSVPIDPTHVAVAGFSAGAGLASNLMACHSDTFSLGIIHSGLEYEAASSLSDAYPAMSMGPTHDLAPTARDGARCAGSAAKLARIVVIQGASDPIVNPKNSSRIVDQFSMIHDWIDDGQQNGSQTNQAIRSTTATAPGGKSYSIETYGSANQEEWIMKVLVNGMGHAWSGGAQGASFTDAAGPSASEMVVQMFLSR